MVSVKNNVSDPVVVDNNKKKRRRRKTRPLSKKFACRQNRKRQKKTNTEKEGTEVDEEILQFQEGQGIYDAKVGEEEEEEEEEEVEEEEDEVGETVEVIEEIIEFEDNEDIDIADKIQEVQVIFNNNSSSLSSLTKFIDNQLTICESVDFVHKSSQVYSEKSEERSGQEPSTLDESALGIFNKSCTTLHDSILSNNSITYCNAASTNQVYFEQSEERSGQEPSTLDESALGIFNKSCTTLHDSILSNNSITYCNAASTNQVYSEQSEERSGQEPSTVDESELGIPISCNVYLHNSNVGINGITNNVLNTSQIYSEQSEEDSIFDESDYYELDSDCDDAFSLLSEVSNHPDLDSVHENEYDISPESVAFNEIYNDDSEPEFMEDSSEAYNNSSRESSFHRLNCRSSDNGQNDNQSISQNKRTDFSSVISGCRIVNVAYFLKELQNFGGRKNHNSKCSRRLEDVDFFQFQNIGLNLLCYVKCLECGFISKIYTNPPKPQNDFHINDTAAISVLGSPSTFASFQTNLAVFNIPYITHKTYQEHRKKMIKPLHAALSHQMHLNALEEAEIAVKNGDVTADGIPCIKVITDGFYSKRSYHGGKYDSLGASVAVIGYATQKVIDVEVLNKNCTTHARYENCDMEPPKHPCYMNFDRKKSSSSMESHGTLKLFNRSLQLHGLIYKTMISDDDSSTYKEILNSNPYRDYGITVERIKCTNHLFRAMGRKIREASKTKVVDTRGVGIIRRKINCSGLKMRKVITCVVDRLRKELDSNSLSKDELVQMFEKNTDILRNNIPIVPFHVFGHHDECPSDWTCDKSKPDYLLKIKEYGLFTRVEKIIADLSGNASHLLHQLTSNRIEQYHAILAKYLIGKRIEFGGADELQDRIYMGALDQATSGRPLSTFYKFCEKDVPERIVKLERERGLQRESNKKYRQANKNKRKRRVISYGADKDYGPNAAQPDLSETDYNLYLLKKEEHHTKLRDRQKIRNSIEAETKQVLFSTSHCFERDMIPSIFFGKICRMLETTSCAPVINDICNPIIYEDDTLESTETCRQASLRKLESVIGHDILPCGIFVSNDEESFYLCARPDGVVNNDSIVILGCISEDEKMNVDEALESNRNMKNIFSKSDPNVVNINHPVYYVIQGQLHVTEREFCYFAAYTPNGLKVANLIRKDDNFWNRYMKNKLERFYNFALIDEIIDSRLERSMPIREALFTIEAKAKKAQKEAEKSAAKASQLSSALDHSVDFSTNGYDADIINNYRQVVLNQSIEEYQENILSSGSYLNDISISRFLLLLEEKNFTIHFPITILNPVKQSTSNNDLLIIGGHQSNQHWCCLHFNGQIVAIYDSLNRSNLSQLSDVEINYLRVQYSQQIKQNLIDFKTVTRQPDGSSCGVYAAAYATTIALGGDPTKFEYSQDAAEMRQHLLCQIIERNQLLQFPCTLKT